MMTWWRLGRRGEANNEEGRENMVVIVVRENGQDTHFIIPTNNMLSISIVEKIS